MADLNNAVVWMVFTHPVIYKSSSACTNPLVTVPVAPITIGIIITYMFHSFFNSLAKLRYLSLFSHSFNFPIIIIIIIIIFVSWVSLGLVIIIA